MDAASLARGCVGGPLHSPPQQLRHYVAEEFLQQRVRQFGFEHIIFSLPLSPHLPFYPHLPLDRTNGKAAAVHDVLLLPPSVQGQKRCEKGDLHEVVEQHAERQIDAEVSNSWEPACVKKKNVWSVRWFLLCII